MPCTFTQTHSNTGMTIRGCRPRNDVGTSIGEHEHGEQREPEHQRPLRLHRERARERGDRQRERAHAVAGRVQRDPEQEHRDATRSPSRRRSGCRSRRPIVDSAPYMISASHDCAIQCVPAAVNEYGSRRGMPWSRISPPVRRCHRNELSLSEPDAEREAADAEQRGDERGHRRARATVRRVTYGVLRLDVRVVRSWGVSTSHADV